MSKRPQHRVFYALDRLSFGWVDYFSTKREAQEVFAMRKKQSKVVRARLQRLVKGTWTTVEKKEPKNAS